MTATTIAPPRPPRAPRARAGSNFRERDPFRIGVVTVVVTAILLALALNANAIVTALGTREYGAVFTEAGGLAPGDEVRIAGHGVGTVASVGLQGASVLVRFRVDSGVRLGGETRADIKTATVLGRKYLALTPRGGSRLDGDVPIPMERTSSPYDVTQTLADLTRTAQQTNTEDAAKALDTIATTFAKTPQDFARTLDGVTRLSRTISTRDEQLRVLFQRAAELSGVLADRRDELSKLLVDGNVLFRALLQQKAQLDQLFDNTSRLCDQLSALVKDGNTTLRPALEQLRQILTLLNKRNKEVDTLLKQAGPYIRSLGEAVGSGPFFQAYIADITPSDFPATASKP